MPGELSITGPIVAIRIDAAVRTLPDRTPLTDDQEVRVIVAARGEPGADTKVPSGEFVRARENAKAELTGICRNAFGTDEVEVTQLTLQQGTLEVFILVAVAVKLVQDFGSLAQGIREIARLVPEPVTRYVRAVSTYALGPQTTVTTGEPRVEMQAGLLSAHQSPTNPAAPRARAGRRRGRAAQPPADEQAQQAQSAHASTTPPEPERRLVAYLLISHALLTVALVATALILVAWRS
ncbi:hypothetical protein [Actinoplanes aureus]|uniref:Uncharacterized protein n=1 Tax=Actinoplanes aureus TaxID=2792083 RepID=A0A931CI19_9ACTN|nr:hypothetical protein [Actinoplanes aureus]MBG0568012.1 hypothetical protein [Actinoplanes aureus]